MGERIVAEFQSRRLPFYCDCVSLPMEEVSWLQSSSWHSSVQWFRLGISHEIPYASLWKDATFQRRKGWVTSRYPRKTHAGDGRLHYPHRRMIEKLPNHQPKFVFMPGRLISEYSPRWFYLTPKPPAQRLTN